MDFIKPKFTDFSRLVWVRVFLSVKLEIDIQIVEIIKKSPL